MAIESKLHLEKYQYGIDIRRGRQLYGMSGKALVLGAWITKEKDRIILVEMNEIIAKRECYFYQELNGHNHIIRTIGYVENPSNLTIFVQEYAQHGDLGNLLLDNEITFSSRIFFEIFSQIVDGMIYIANKSIIHGDLACRNILVYKIDSSVPKNSLVKITDFGLARSSLTNDDSSIIPVRYCAPEILRVNLRSNYSEKSDVYSMGVLMWEALSNGEMPYSSISSDDVVKAEKLSDKKLIRPTNCDRQFWNLMEKCWSFELKQRLIFKEIQEELSGMMICDLSDIQFSISTFQSPISCEYKLNIDVRMKELLNGSYGKIYEAEWILKEERSIVLIKIHKQITEYELLFYTKLKVHPHIIYTFGFVENDIESMILLQERAPHGNLQILFETNQFQPTTEILIEIFLQIIDTMIYITKQNLVHGNLCCGNILVFQMNEMNIKENFIKLTNFTSAHVNDPSSIKDKRSTIPVRYCAPEILRSVGHSNYCELSDVYSMGVLMWEACSNGEVPYSSSILNSDIRQRKLNGEKLSQPWLCNNGLWSIMEDCWHHEPQLRYNFEEMKVRFSKISLDKCDQIYHFNENVNIKINEQVHGKFGKTFSSAEWISKKEIPIIVLTMNEETTRQELSFYRELNSHKHIIYTFGLVKNDRRLTILVQEYTSHGNLQVLLRNKQFNPSIDVLVEIFVQILDAMIYINTKNIVYGNLCCKNVLVFQMNSSKSKENLIKLTNFNQSHPKNSSLVNEKYPMIPVRYCAPELVGNTDERHSCELSDVYSMGVLMWEACSEGNIPYETLTNDNDIRQLILNGEKLSQPNQCLNSLWNIVQDCWYMEPQLRYHFHEIHIRLSSLREICSHCENGYLIDNMSSHELVCPPKCISMLPISIPSESIREPVDELSSNTESIQSPITPPMETIENRSDPPQPSTVNKPKSIFQRLSSFFRRKHE